MNKKILECQKKIEELELQKKNFAEKIDLKIEKLNEKIEEEKNKEDKIFAEAFRKIYGDVSSTEELEKILAAQKNLNQSEASE